MVVWGILGLFLVQATAFSAPDDSFLKNAELQESANSFTALVGPYIDQAVSFIKKNVPESEKVDPVMVTFLITFLRGFAQKSAGGSLAVATGMGIAHGTYKGYHKSPVSTESNLEKIVAMSTKHVVLGIGAYSGGRILG